MTLMTRRRRPTRSVRKFGVLLLLSLFGLAPSIQAQQPRLAPAAIGQMVDAVLSKFVSPDQRVSRVPAAKRGVYFDHLRSMRAFGYTGNVPFSIGDLHLRNAVKPGSEHLMDDCGGPGMHPCRQLGWGIYVAVEPIAVSDSDAVVRAIILWADRGPAAFEEGVVPTGPSILVGFTSEVQLARTSDGRWEFARVMRTRVSD